MERVGRSPQASDEMPIKKFGNLRISELGWNKRLGSSRTWLESIFLQPELGWKKKPAAGCKDARIWLKTAPNLAGLLAGLDGNSPEPGWSTSRTWMETAPNLAGVLAGPGWKKPRNRMETKSRS